MDVQDKSELLTAKGLERRTMPRCAVDEEATLLLINHGSLLRCRLVELSLDGCRMNASARVPPGVLVRVEATFKVRGIAFRFGGVGAWTDGENQVGIRFVDMPYRRRDELAGVLCEVELENAARAEMQAAEHRGSEEQTALQIAEKPVAEAVPDGLSATEQRAREGSGRRADKPALRPAEGRAGVTAPAEPRSAEPQQAPLKPPTQTPAHSSKPTNRERRVQSRHEVDTSALILLVNVGSWLQGRILDLSLSGCRIRSEERFPVGIYTRVEIEFRLEGLPFRLGGVIQAIHDRNHVGIRFLDVSERKRVQVEQLIEEIEEMHARRSLEEAS
ncbi:MAG: PilZ domain-containing protein [Terracidiphilus sp.]|jgi:c-di-GMP-binding flagellar brake protein YcgR